ncbi:hypothetical protein ACFL5O_04215 [Myxococcota bacterium]
MTDGDGSSEQHGTLSLVNGPAPELLGSQSPAAEQTTTTRWLASRRNEGLALHKIAVFARTSRLLEEQVQPALRAARLPVLEFGSGAGG